MCFRTSCVSGREWGWRPWNISALDSFSRVHLSSHVSFQRSAWRGEWLGAEHTCYPMQGRAGNLRQLWSWEHREPREPHRNVPSKTAVLVRIRLSCCNKGPHSRVAKGSLHLSHGRSGGRQSKAGLAGLTQEAPVPDVLSSQRTCPDPPRQVVAPTSELTFPAAGQREKQKGPASLS